MSQVELDFNFLSGLETPPSHQKKTSSFFPANDFNPGYAQSQSNVSNGSNTINSAAVGFMSPPFSSPLIGGASKFFSKPTTSGSLVGFGISDELENPIPLNESLNMLSINNTPGSKILRSSTIWNNSPRPSSAMEEENDPYLFSPFLSMSNLFIEEEEAIKPVHNNIYLSKVNKPSFIPSFQPNITNNPATILQGQISGGKKITKVKDTRKERVFKNENEKQEAHKEKQSVKNLSCPSSTSTSTSSSSSSCSSSLSIKQSSSSEITSKKKKKNKKKKKEHSPKSTPFFNSFSSSNSFSNSFPECISYTSSSSIPTSSPSLSASSFDSIIVNFPKHWSVRKPSTDSNNLFNEYLLASDNTKSTYHEDYCSTFYKRNQNGYMFVKEPANSLKVNSNGIGTKSWVQLKINIPVNGLSSKKIKIDIRELPYWKPASTLSSKLKKPKSRDIRESVSYREKKRGKRRHST